MQSHPPVCLFVHGLTPKAYIKSGIYFHTSSGILAGLSPLDPGLDLNFFKHYLHTYLKNSLSNQGHIFTDKGGFTCNLVLRKGISGFGFIR